MSKLPVVFRNFEGGWATDLKIGIKNSFAYSQAIDFRKSPSQLTVLPGTRREDAGVVNDLIQNEVMARDGTIYAIGSAGGFYKRTTAGAWSQEANINVGTFGIDYRYDADSIYITQNKSVSLYNNVSGINGSPSMYMSYYGSSFSTYNNTSNVGFNVNTNQTGSSLTTTLTVATTPLNENSTLKRFFQSDIEPLNKIQVFVVSKGTGDWTLTLHDGANNLLGTSTVTNANLANNTFNDFSFTAATNSQVRIYVAPNARTYHFHLTSTVADGTVSSSATNDLSTCDLHVWADRMVQTTNGMHPIQRFLQYECIGNGNYVSIWEPITDPPTNSEWQRHKLVFPMEYEVCGLAQTNEFLVIAAEKVSSNSTLKPQDGLIFFWDGTSNTYNYNVPIPEGAPYGLHTYKNVVYYYAGGDWWAITSPLTQPVKIRKMPNSDSEYLGSATAITIYPYAATVRRGIHLMAYPSMTTSTSINYGVYSWGAVDKNFPESFGYNYLISTGSQNYSVSNNLTIGMVKSFGDILHVSWRDTTSGGYGIDVIDNTSTPAAASSWESLIFDNGFPLKTKTGAYLTATFLTLPSDASFKLKYKLDRASSWTYSSSFTAANVLSRYGSNYARLDINNPNRFMEIQVGIDITSGTTTPTFTSLTLVFDDNKAEALI